MIVPQGVGFFHHPAHAAMGPHRRGGGHHGGRHHGPPFMGGDGFPAGRKLSATDLQLLLIALLAERPAHGYELIRTLDERSGGFYAPSSGMVYPALTYLDEIGHAASAQDGNRRLYTITPAGQGHLDTNRAQAEAMLEALTRIGGRMGEVRDAFAGLDEADPHAGDELHAARGGLKHALKRKHGCSQAEARRIAAILDRATADILTDPAA